MLLVTGNDLGRWTYCSRRYALRQPAGPPYLKPMKTTPLILLLVVLSACTRRARPYDFPRPVDTATRPITLQEKRDYSFPEAGLTFDNQFDGARLNNVRALDAATFEISIEPENQPINSSPWYAFRIRPTSNREITVRLVYPDEVQHRYFPKISEDRRVWAPVDSTRVVYNLDSTSIDVRLMLRANQPVYFAGQEVINSADVDEWITDLAAANAVINRSTIGQSKLGRPLPLLRISRGEELAERPTIVIFSRQHPPEVTGYLAMQAFLERVLDHPQFEELLDSYQFLVFPLLNPDGVDLGHWRHTAGGVDSNRDWAFYNQPEARQVADYVVRQTRKADSQVVLGLDFHSTHYDVYYTFNEEAPPTIFPDFKDEWLRKIEQKVGGDFRINEEAEPLGRPTSMAWFRTQFGAEGITYEIGDGTDRTFVTRKGQLSADAMIEVLLN